MKKLLLLMTGALLIAATAQADCGSCEGDAAKEKAKEKAACEIKAGTEKAECATDKAADKMKKAECATEKPACEMKKGKAKAEAAKDKACEIKKECDKSAGQKKWYNPVSWFK